MSEQLHFCHTIEQHVDVQNRKPCNVSFFVSDCHFYLTCQRKKKICYGFWALYVSPRTKVSFSFLFLSSSLQLQFSVKWDLKFRLLESKNFRIVHYDFKKDLSVARNKIASSLSYIFLYEHHFNPEVSKNIGYSKSVLHKCLYRHTLKETLNLYNCLNLLKLGWLHSVGIVRNIIPSVLR